MTSTSSTGHDSDDAKLPGNYTGSAASHLSLPTMRRDGRSFLNLPAEIRCIVYEYFLPEDQLAVYPTPLVYNVLLHICKQIREEAQREIQKAADEYFHAHHSEWLRNPGFRFTIEPIIDPTEVKVIIPEAFFEFDQLETLFLKIPLLRLRLRNLTFDISTAISGTSHPYKTYLLRYLHFWIKEHHEPQALRTTIHWGHCESRVTALDMSGFCRRMELRPYFYDEQSKLRLLTYSDNITHQGDEHSVLEAVSLTFQRLPWSQESFLKASRSPKCQPSNEGVALALI